jgi:hypothetical protein
MDIRGWGCGGKMSRVYDSQSGSVFAGYDPAGVTQCKKKSD